MNLKNYLESKERVSKIAQEEVSKKREEYTEGNTDVLINFKVLGEFLNIPAEQVCLTFILKHLLSIKTHVMKRKSISEAEPLITRFADVIEYLYLLYALLEESVKPQSEKVDEEWEIIKSHFTGKK